MSADEQVEAPTPGPEGGNPGGGSGLGGMEAAVRAGTTPSSAAEAGEAHPEPAGVDELEERAEELADLAAIQDDPGGGLVGSEPAARTGQASAGSPTGTGPLGLGTLDQGATSQVTGTGEPTPAEDQPPET